MGVSIGTFHVRRSIWIRASPARVWQEFETLHQLSAWFGRGHRLEAFEPGADGRIDLSVDIDGERRGFGGDVLVWEPARELTFEDNWHPPHAWPASTLVTLRLTPAYDGTLVELFHHGFERLGAEAADALEGYEAGWTSRHLEALRGIVERPAA